MTVQQYRACIA